MTPLGIACALSLLALGAVIVAHVLRRRRGAASRTAARLRGASVAMSVLALGVMVAGSLPMVAWWLAAPLEARADQLAREAPPGATYDAIVVLGGAVQAPTRDVRSLTGLNESSDRVWHAARLWHARLAPKIIASGGPEPEPDDDFRQAEAVSMKEFLGALGVPWQAVLLEYASRNTRENVAYSAKLLGDARRVALVTSALHMPRALRAAREAGLEADAYPTDYLALHTTPRGLQAWVPDAGAMVRTGHAIKEWVAQATGR